MAPADPERDVRKRPRRTDSLAEEAPHTSTSYRPLDARATEPDTNYGHGDDFSREFSPHKTERFLAHVVKRSESLELVDSRCYVDPKNAAL